ncbi:MAG TPA: hypothetical protein VF766_08095 [Pyrinomonadaceae bacterium]
MKKKASATILALLVLTLAASTIANAQTAGQAAAGTYQFSFDDGYTKTLEFDARTSTNGSASGQMTFTDEARVVIQDVDGTGEKEVTYPGYYIKADLDGLVVNQNQAVMSGTVRDSSVRELIGQRVLLTVEDNGDNTRVPDRLTWGIYQPVSRDWTPSDAELKEDPGVGLTWWATDAEVRDDKGYKMPRSEAIDTQTYPVSAYNFVEFEKGAGDIRVQG